MSPAAAAPGSSPGALPTPEPASLSAPLATTRTGTGPRLVLLHGFTQHAGTWGPFGSAVGRGRELVAVDLPGHGRSTHVHGDLTTTAELVATSAGPGDYLGYSLGGRVALHVALGHPELVRRLVLVGTTPGIEDPVARARRRADDEARADELDPPRLAPDDQGPERRLRSFLERWLASALFAGLSPDAAQLEARLTNRPEGLAASLRECGTGTQAPLWDRLGALTMPVLVVAGVLDVRFAAVGTRMVSAIGPNARLALVPGAGHACHLQQPALTARIVGAFLDPLREGPDGR